MIQSSPADHGAAETHEGLVDVVAFIKAGPKAAELMKQGQGLFNDPAEDAQPTAMFFSTSGDGGGDATG
jgi:hypothetical protein